MEWQHLKIFWKSGQPDDVSHQTELKNFNSQHLVASNGTENALFTIYSWCITAFSIVPSAISHRLLGSERID